MMSLREKKKFSDSMQNKNKKKTVNITMYDRDEYVILDHRSIYS